MAILETLTLDGLALNDTVTWMMQSADFTPPPEMEEWIKGADSDGAILAREPKTENRVIEVRLQVERQASMDLALAKIALLVDKLKECQRQANGLPLVWTPADGTKSVTFRCLSGQVTGLPVDLESGWFFKAPTITVKLTCLPFWEAAEVQAATITSSDPMISFEVSGVGGDVPALGRLVVLDAATKNRRWVAWGLESRFYPTTAPPALGVDSTAFVTAGYTGVVATRADAFSGATGNVVRGTLRTRAQAICGLPDLGHVGSFRPQLRFHASATTMALRLTYQALDGPLRSLSYRVPVTVGWNQIDLGLIRVPEKQLGAQRWTGRIDAYSTGAGGETLDLDVMWLLPAESFGRARGAYTYATGVVTGADEFTGIATGTALNARVAPLGGTWGTQGSATDIVAADAPNATDETMTRSTVSDTNPRWALLGATNYIDTEASIDFYATAGVPRARVIARWNGANDYLYAQANFNPASNELGLGIVRAGVDTEYARVSWPFALGAWWQLRLVVFASGRAIGTILRDGAIVVQRELQNALLATAGGLASGLAGFADHNPSATASTRYYDNFYSATPPAEQIVCYSGRSIEFRSAATLRTNAANTFAGEPSEYVGSRFFLPPAGGPARKTRVAVIARSNDIEAAADNDLAANATMDSTTVTVFKTERGLVVPR